MMDVIKIPNFITEDECDIIIEEILAMAGERKDWYGVGLGYQENPLELPRV